MPIYKTKNENFFKRWNAEMAYVLGYIAADGAITIGKRGNCYLEVQSVDLELIKIVQRALKSNHAISVRRRKSQWQTIYRLQIGSKKIVYDLTVLGVFPKKTKRLVMPQVPRKYFPDFVRGYFDGDGNILYTVFCRKDRKYGFGQWIRILFTSSSRSMLENLRQKLTDNLNLQGAHLEKKNNYYRLYYYRDVIKFFKFFYGHNPKFYLRRKFLYFRDALKKYGGA